MEFPRLVYRFDGDIRYKPVACHEAYEAALNDGWSDSVPEAMVDRSPLDREIQLMEPPPQRSINPPHPKSNANRKDDPVRMEMEEKARKYNIKKYWIMTDETLAERVRRAELGV